MQKAPLHHAAQLQVLQATARFTEIVSVSCGVRALCGQPWVAESFAPSPAFSCGRSDEELQTISIIQTVRNNFLCKNFFTHPPAPLPLGKGAGGMGEEVCAGELTAGLQILIARLWGQNHRGRRSFCPHTPTPWLSPKLNVKPLHGNSANFMAVGRTLSSDTGCRGRSLPANDI